MFVYQERVGGQGDFVGIADLAGFVYGDDERQLVFGHIGAHFGFGVKRQGNGDGLVSRACKLALGFDQFWHFSHAAWARWVPKIDEGNLALQLFFSHRLVVQIKQGKWRGGRALVGEQGKRHQGAHEHSQCRQEKFFHATGSSKQFIAAATSPSKVSALPVLMSMSTKEMEASATTVSLSFKRTTCSITALRWPIFLNWL